MFIVFCRQHLAAPAFYSVFVKTFHSGNQYVEITDLSVTEAWIYSKSYFLKQENKPVSV